MKNKKLKDSIIIVPMIVTAFWERLFSPGFDIFMNYLLSFGNNFITHISNLIYTRIAKGVYINISYYIFIILMSVIVVIFLFNTYNVYKCNIKKSCNENDEIIEIDNNKKDKNKFEKIISLPKVKFGLSLFYSISIICFYLFFLLMTNFINNTITNITNSIEILSPYISDSEYKMLKSQFYTMESRNDYDIIISDLTKYQEQFEIILKY